MTSVGNNLTLSVVIPAYNSSGYLGRVLQAILTQSLQPLEVVVIDDGSTDNSIEVIEEFRRDAPSVRFLRNDRNRGVAYTIHRGLEAVVGEYVYFASTSDRVLPGLFQRSMELLTEHPQAALFCSDFVAFYSQGPQFTYRFGWAKSPSFLSPQELARTLKRKGGYIPGATAILKRSALVEAGGFIEELKGHTDWFACLVMGFRYGICYAPEPLAAFRMGQPGSLSSGHRQWATQREILSKLFALLESRPYHDVESLFQSSAALACLPHILRELLGESGRPGYLTSDLIRHALWDEFRRVLVRMTPMSVKESVQRLRRLGGMGDQATIVD